MAPAFDGWGLTPPISNHTLRGSDFFEPLAWTARGITLTRGRSRDSGRAAGAPFQVAQL
jgi:hypothetical protein